MNEHIEALLNGSELSEEAQEKVQSIFEAAVADKAAEIQAAADKSLEEAIAEKTAELDKKVEEAVDAQVAEALESVDGYLTFAVNEWYKDNEIAIESGLKVEQAENFLSGMATMLESANVAVPEGSADVVAEAEEKVQEATDKLNAQLESNIQLTMENENLKRAAIICDVCEGLADTEVEKIIEASKGLTFADAESFETRLKDLVESYFPAEADDKTEVVSEEVVVEEVEEEPVSEDAPVDYAQHLSGYFKTK